MGMMDEMMESMMGGISKGDRMEMMGKMMEKFFADMTAEDKQQMMEQMMPGMMEGMNMMEMMPKMMMGMMGGGEGCGGMEGMMSQMMGSGEGACMPTMPHMMAHMMPHCLHMMLPHLPVEERVCFVLHMVGALAEHGSAGMSEEERSDFTAKIIERVTREPSDEAQATPD